jgi:hypothetical protein
MTRETRTYTLELTADVERVSDLPTEDDVAALFLAGANASRWPGLHEVTVRHQDGGRVASKPTPTQ